MAIDGNERQKMKKKKKDFDNRGRRVRILEIGSSSLLL
jgi:hypothetical protein